MYEINVFDMEFEKCSKDKEHLNLIIPYAVIHFVLDGEGFVNGEKISKNTAVISYKETIMNYFPSEDNPWSYIYVRLSGLDLQKAFLEYDFNLEVSFLPFDKKNELNNLLALHKSLCSDNNPEAEKVIANAIFLLFSKKTSQYKTMSVQQQNAEKIKKYIDENYHKKLSVKSIAERFFLSKDYVRNLFVRFYGISPKHYIQNIKMEKAKELLGKTNINVTLIANSVGYDDALLFSKMFTKYFSVSPTEYRNKII